MEEGKMTRSPHVVIGFHHYGFVNGNFAFALARGVAYEGNRIKSVIHVASPYVDQARNQLVEMFLALPHADYFLMVDADIEFEKDSVSKTMQVMQNTGADVVWGNYALGTFGNSLFEKDPKTEAGISLENLKPDTIYTGIYTGGTGWVMMTREILEKMREKYPAPWHWFDRDLVNDVDGKPIRLGEDIGFGRRVHLIGGKQAGFTGCALIHHKFHATVPVFMAPLVESLGRPVIRANHDEASQITNAPDPGVQKAV